MSIHPLIHRLTAVVVFIAAIFLLDRYQGYRVFSLNLLEATNRNLFRVFGEARTPDPSLVILNTGTLNEDEIIQRIDVLLEAAPRIIGINTCDFKASKDFLDHFQNNPRVVISFCGNNGRTKVARVVSENNEVTHFGADFSDYFEIRVADAWPKLKKRNHTYERINFHENNFVGMKVKPFAEIELSSVDDAYAEQFAGATLLVGYAGDQLPTFHVNGSGGNLKAG